MEKDEMKGMFYGIIAHGTILVILDAIKRNGIEKTLEDLHKVCTAGKTKPSERIYQALLNSLKDINEIAERGADYETDC